MGYALQFYPKHKILLLTVSGTLTEAIMLDAYAAVGRFVSAEGACAGIADFSAV